MDNTTALVAGFAVAFVVLQVMLLWDNHKQHQALREQGERWERASAMLAGVAGNGMDKLMHTALEITSAALKSCVEIAKHPFDDPTPADGEEKSGASDEGSADPDDDDAAMASALKSFGEVTQQRVGTLQRDPDAPDNWLATEVTTGTKVSAATKSDALRGLMLAVAARQKREEDEKATLEPEGEA